MVLVIKCIAKYCYRVVFSWPPIPNSTALELESLCGAVCNELNLDTKSLGLRLATKVVTPKGRRKSISEVTVTHIVWVPPYGLWAISVWIWELIFIYGFCTRDGGDDKSVNAICLVCIQAHLLIVQWINIFGIFKMILFMYLQLHITLHRWILSCLYYNLVIVRTIIK